MINDKIKSVNFYDGLLLTEDEFSVEQNYHTMMRRLHNLAFHGLGIAYGLEVEPTSAANEIRIKPGLGLVLKRAGENALELAQEIFVEEPIVIGMPGAAPTQPVRYLLYLDVQTQKEQLEPLKGDLPVLNVEVPFAMFEPFLPGDTVQLSRRDRLLLAIVEVSENLLLGGISLQIIQVLNGEPVRRYCGLDVRESKAEKFLLGVGAANGSISESPLGTLSGAVSADQKNGIEVLTPFTDFRAIGGVETNVNIYGKLNLQKAPNSPQSGTMNIAADCVIQGNLTVSGTTTTVNTTDLNVKDNILTLNKFDGDSFNGDAGIEIFLGNAKVPAQLVWNTGSGKWAVKDGLIYNELAYGPKWLDLSHGDIGVKKNVDHLHFHSIITPDGIMEALVADDTGKIGIGTTTPSAHLDLNFAPTNDALKITASGSTTPALKVSKDGSVQINTVSPEQGRLKIGGGVVIERDSTVADSDANLKFIYDTEKRASLKADEEAFWLTGKMNTPLRLSIDDPSGTDFFDAVLIHNGAVSPAEPPLLEIRPANLVVTGEMRVNGRIETDELKVNGEFEFGPDLSISGNLTTSGNVNLATASGAEIRAHLKRIQDVANPEGPQDAETKFSVEGKIAAALASNVPVGTIMTWHKSFSGVPALPPSGEWVECNGQTINDIASLLNGQVIPNLNGHPDGADSPGQSAKVAMFLRGGIISGTGQADAFQGHWHGAGYSCAIFNQDAPGGYGPTGGSWDMQNWQIRNPIADTANGTPRTANETRPVNMSVVYIMKIK